jgi:hypothetical protein
MAESEYPSLGDQGKNLAKFTFEVLKEAFKGGTESLFVNEEIQRKRLDICRACNYFDPDQGRCRHCGCFLAYKVRFSLESCPLEKWTVSEEDWMEKTFDQFKEKILNPDPETPRPRFPFEKELGTKYSWTMPEPDGRTLHWYWNGSMWEFDETPDEPNYSEEEVEAHRLMIEEQQRQFQSDTTGFVDHPIMQQDSPDVMMWKKMERERLIAEGIDPDVLDQKDEKDEQQIDEDTNYLIDSIIDEIAMNTLESVVEEEVKPKKKRGRPKKVKNTEN